MALPPFPWLYPYQEDGPRLESIVLRPIVPISLVGADIAPPSFALVDSGCEHVLAAPWLANAVGVDADQSDRRLALGIGGQTVEVRFSDLTLRLHAPSGSDEQFVEWHTEVGFVDQWRPTWPMLVGQIGFFDKFTVTMSRVAQLVAIEPGEEFDGRFGVRPVA